MTNRFPVIVTSHLQIGGNKLTEAYNEQTVYNQNEYDEYKKIADKHNRIVKSRPPPDLLAALANEDEIASLEKRKLILDVDAAEKFQRSYPFTKWSAYIALGISIILLLLEIAKDIGWIHDK